MSTYSFPSIAVPDKEKKNSEYYDKWVRAIVSNSFTDNWTTNYNRLKVLYSFYQDGTGNDLTGYLQTAPDGSAMPGIWTTQNSVKTRMRSLIGELEERGYLIKARAINSEAQSRKLEERERLRVKRKLQSLAQYVEQETGLSMEYPEYVPQSDEELREYIDLTWKDKNVLILEGALKWIAKRSHWDEARKRLFIDVLIANIMVVKDEIIKGIPQSRHVDPMRFIYDPNSTDDMLSDSTYFGEVDYIPLSVAAERYGLTEEELQESYNTYQSFLGMGVDNRGTQDPGWGCMPGQVLKWFKAVDGTPRCLVIKACWRDYKTLAHKYERKEEYDTEHLQDVTDKEVRKRDEDKIIYNKIECWRQGTIIGGKFLREWGECPNQARDLDSLEISEAPYKVWIPEFLLGKSTSIVEQLTGLQLLKDIALYQLQIQMARAVGKVIVFDEAMMPNGMTRESVTRYIKADGIAWVNSKEYQLGSGMNLFKDYDLSLSESIGQAINLIEYFDRQIDNISGVNAERQGQLTTGSQAVGNTQAVLFQSNLITAPYFKGFERFCSRVLNHQAKLVKVAWAAKEKFAPIIGDVGVDFLKDNIDISLDSFDVVVESLPPSTIDRQKLEQMLSIVIQVDPEFIDYALEIMLEQDITVAVRKFQRLRLQRRRLQKTQEQAQMEQEQQNQQQQMDLQQQQLQFQMQNSPTALQQMKNQGNLQKTLVTSRTKLNESKLKLLGQ